MHFKLLFSGSNTSVNREGRPTSQAGKTKRERFARSRSGITLPISIHLARLRFRDKSSASTGFSQSYDAGDQSSEMNDSFEETRPVKRTSSAPSREGTPPIRTDSDKAQSSPAPTPTTKTHPVSIPIIRDTIPEIRYASPSTSGEGESAHVTLQVESSPKHETEANASSTATGGAKLQGIIQPLRTSSPHSGWL